MSLYSGNIVSDLIDPNTNVQNRKVEFKLNPHSGYYNNLRVANLGVRVAGKNYDQLAGVYGVLKNIYLYDGRRELDSLREANRYLGFTNLLYPNEVNQSQRHKLVKHNIGYSIDDSKKIQQRFQLDLNGGAEDQTTANNNEGDSTRLGYLDLRQALPLLQNMIYLDTDQTFKNLKVVIEFETKIEKVLTNNANAFNVEAPILIADEILDPNMRMKLAKEMTGAVWNCIEHDQFQVAGNLSVNADADTRAVEQTTNKKVDGFNNKQVSRVVIMKERTDQANLINANNVVGFGQLSSVAQHKEKVQVVLNGKPLFAGNDGIENEGYKAQLLSMTFGNINLAPYDNLECIGSDSPVANSVHKTGVRPLVANKQSNETGGLNYIGFSIEDKINDLQVTYKRTNVKYTNGEANQPLNAPLNIHLYAEVRKQITISGGNYQINYV